MSHFSYQDDAIWERSTMIGRTSPYDTMQMNTKTAIDKHYHGKPITDSDVYKVGIYGWRKRCLYMFILLLSIVIIVNLAMTAWIMNVLDFSSSGMGALIIQDDGIRVTGRAEFDRPVHFRNLATNEGKALSIDSAKGLYMSARNLSGHVTSSLNLTPDGKAEVICDQFQVYDHSKQLLFFVDRHEIGLKLKNLRILDEGGSVFEGAIQTSVIRPEPDLPLRLESPTRNVLVDAAQDIELLSRAGDIQLTSLLDIDIKTDQGEIHLDSANIFVSGLEETSGNGHPQLQVCLCKNGRLFLARKMADCRADRVICK